MTRIYFIRHGETEWNKTKRFQGFTDIPLSDIGKAQAALLGKRFESIPIDVIYSSPLIRAYETAAAVAVPKKMEIMKNDHFKEINFGEWEGLTGEELTKLYGDQFIRLISTPEIAEFPGDGSLQLVTKRVKLGLDAVIAENENKNVMIVSHGGLIRLCIFYLMGMDLSFYNKMWLNNTSVSIVDINKRGNVLYKVNDDAHLENFD